jgi:hypothetical protein
MGPAIECIVERTGEVEIFGQQTIDRFSIFRDIRFEDCLGRVEFAGHECSRAVVSASSLV